MISQVAAFVVPSKLADSGQIQAQPDSNQYRNTVDSGGGLSHSSPS
jgi:hypothetical protein